jgi:hypothetical protein
VSNRKKAGRLGWRRITLPADAPEWLGAFHAMTADPEVWSLASAMVCVADKHGRFSSDDLEDHLGLERGSLREDP